MLAASAWVALAEVARPHGVQGEVKLRLFNRESDVLLHVQHVLTRSTDGHEAQVSVERARRTPDGILMKLHSVDDRSRADELRGAVVCARRGDLPVLGPGEFYACDIEGARVMVERGDGAGPLDVGRVIGLHSYPASEALVVEPVDGGPPWEVPLVDAIVRSVDVEASLVVLVTLQGVERG